MWVFGQTDELQISSSSLYFAFHSLNGALDDSSLWVPFLQWATFTLDPADFDDIIKCSVVSEIRSLEVSVKPGSVIPYLTQQPQGVYSSPETQ